VTGSLSMTELLKKAIERVKQLAASEQDAIAAMILEEIADEEQWDVAFARSQDGLAKLAAQAMEEYRAGKTEELDLESL